ncbi:MAG: CotH kinase family protein, partial [Flavobacteriaceae bacterium]
MKLIFRPDGTRNYLTDINTTAFLNYDGDIGIELRGSSSQSNLLDKKPYGFTTLLEDGISNNNVSLLGMPSENDWVLNSLAFDASMIRDYLSYTLASNMGNYAPRVKYIEVIVNEDYKGVYILTEKIKIDSDRVDLTKLSDSDNSSPEVTGGYIIKADKTTGGDAVAWSMPGYNYETNFLHDKPKTEDITSQQVNYIEDVFNDLAAETNPPNTSILNGYPSIIDIPSFVDYIIMAEITSNVDSYQYSTFFHKDRGGKLRAGPVWDYNLTYGNDLFWWGYDRSLFDVWQFDLDNTGAKFWKDLSQDATFKCYLAKRWFELTDENQALNYNTIENQIDEYVALLSESKEREQERWRTVSDHLTNIAAMKVWIQNRINWISDNIGSTNNCLNVTVPNLVISKIHYNPLEDGEYSSKNLEYIEITNNTDQSVDLTGYYIRELGISYQFPANTSVTANQRIYLCSNTTAFENYYGISPFGQFTRNLSNSSYKIILSDAFGNTIDEVTYQDDTPWPENADGSGSYLELIDLNSDNSLASNWRDSTAPQLNITVDDSNPDEFEVSFTFDKAVTNFDVSDIELDNANIVSFAANFNGLEYTLKITPQTTTTSPCITISVADGAANMPGGASLAFVNIPDTNFKTALLASTSIDTNEDNLISCSEAAAYTGTISVGDKNIGSLAGIEAFVNITGLNCSRNTLTSLDLSYNTALKTLECYTNSLESLKVSN